jgi:4-amino-4-deoxy-L-arabinose transferase-like glycosyltransferase
MNDGHRGTGERVLRCTLLLLGLALLGVALLAGDLAPSLLRRLRAEGEMSAGVRELAGILRLLTAVLGGLLVVLAAAWRPIRSAMRRLVETFAGWSASRQAALVIGLGAVVRLVWVLAATADPTADFAWYDLRARGIAAGDGFVVDGEPTAYWPVGWPAFLAGFYAVLGTSSLAVELLIVFLNTLTLWLTWRLARDLAGPRLALVATAIYALYPAPVYMSAVLASEHLFTPLFLGGLIVTNRLAGAPERRFLGGAAAVGLLWGLATLVRSLTMLLPSVVFLWLLLRRWRFTRAVAATALLGMVLAAVLVPWALRNHARFGRLIPVSDNGANNFYYGNWRHADGGKYTPPWLYAEYRRQQERDARPHSLGWRLGAEALAERPDRIPGLLLLKWRNLVVNGRLGAGWELGPEGTPRSRPLRYLLVRMGELVHWAILLLAAIGVVRRWRDGVVAALLPVWLCLGYWLLVHGVFFGQPRFLLPLLPLLSMVAATAFVRPRPEGRGGAA